MKYIVVVDLDGTVIGAQEVEDAVTGVFPIYSITTPEPIEDEEPQEPTQELTGYQVAIPVSYPFAIPRFDLDLWDAYLLDVENDKLAYETWLQTPEDERGDAPIQIAGNPSDFWIEGKEFDLVEYKKMKANQILTMRESDLTAGFISNSIGEAPIEFSYDQLSQDRFTKQATLLSINPSIEEVQWKSKYDGFLVMTREQFINVLNEAAQHEITIEFKFLYAEANILNADNKEQVDDVVDSW